VPFQIDSIAFVAGLEALRHPKSYPGGGESNLGPAMLRGK
jgi:hypothetical protein